MAHKLKKDLKLLIKNLMSLLAWPRVVSRKGYCPVCRKEATFSSDSAWLRDNYRCHGCASIPRDRQLLKHIHLYFPVMEEERAIVEYGPGNEFVKDLGGCYTGCQYWPERKFGETFGDFRNEDMENSTFPDDSFDLVCHADIMEHLFHPERALLDNCRILRPGGVAIFVFPVYRELPATIQMANVNEGGRVEYYYPPEYHGSPVGGGKCLVVWKYAVDIINRFRSIVEGINDGHSYEFFHTTDKDESMGIDGEFLDVVCVRKH